MSLPCKKRIEGCVNVYGMPQISPFHPLPHPFQKRKFSLLKTDISVFGHYNNQKVFNCNECSKDAITAKSLSFPYFKLI